jgi:hypothetical protein
VGSKLNPGVYDCYARARQDEPMFTLLARDASAPGMVRQWAYERQREITRGDRPISDAAMVAEARKCADEMEEWRQRNDGIWRHGEDPPAPPAAA